MKGRVWFTPDNKLDVILVNACYPNVTGREPRYLGRVQVKVKVMSQFGRGQTWELPEKTDRFDEKSILNFCDGWVCSSGGKLQRMSCEELIRRDLVVFNTVKLRFEIQCL